MLILTTQVSFNGESRFGFKREYDHDHFHHAFGRRRYRQSRQAEQSYFSPDIQVAKAATEEGRAGGNRGDDGRMARDHDNNDDSGSGGEAPSEDNRRKRRQRRGDRQRNKTVDKEKTAQFVYETRGSRRQR